jgi:hypothetical protein
MTVWLYNPPKNHNLNNNQHQNLIDDAGSRKSRGTRISEHNDDKRKKGLIEMRTTM